jgi:pilus assembly protein CpaC
MFIITPRLMKPLGPNYALPTDSFVPPSRTEFFFGGKMEGSGSPDVPPDRGGSAPPPNTPAPAGGTPPASVAPPPREPAGGFQIK